MEQGKWFSARHGYVKASNVIITNRITDGFRNGIINAYIKLKERQIDDFWHENQRVSFELFDKYMYGEFMKANRLAYKENAMFEFLNNRCQKWYRFFDFIECSLEYLRHSETFSKYDIDTCIDDICNVFVSENYGYRVDLATLHIVPITSREEIQAIDDAVKDSAESVQTHLQTAIKHLSAAQQEPDYRNSIKESISAVEACCREITGESTLGKALDKLESRGVRINGEMKKGFEKLYHYTNDATTGIRHALMEDTASPTKDEAIYMMVVCSAFINYLNNKIAH